MPHERSDRLFALQFEIVMRLRPVCEDWPESRFEHLVRSVAETTLKYETSDRSKATPERAPSPTGTIDPSDAPRGRDDEAPQRRRAPTKDESAYPSLWK